MAKSDRITEKWGYKIGDALIRYTRGKRALVSVTGFTKKYVRASDGNLFTPDGCHIARGSGLWYQSSYEVATDSTVKEIVAFDRKCEIIGIIADLKFSDMSLEDLEIILKAVPEKYINKKI